MPKRKVSLARFKKIRLLLIDVDGVLAKPQITWTANTTGKTLYETKSFCVQDGSATWAAKEAGLIQVVISGRESKVVRKRMQRLSVDELCLGSLDKLKVLERLKKKYSVSNQEIAYIGDDFLDIPIFKKVGLGIAVSDASPEIKKVAHVSTQKRGGEGAVAEALRMILVAQKKWDLAIERTLRSIYG